MQCKTRFLTVVLIGLIGSVSYAGNLPADFTLGRYVPGNAWMFMNSTHSPERAWVDEQIGEVFQALKDSDIHSDIISAVLSLLDEGDRAEAQATIDRATELIEGVRWGDLFGGEVAFAERISARLPGYEYILLAQGKEGSAAQNIKALVAILEEIASLSEKLTVSHHAVKDVEKWSLAVMEGPSADVLTIVRLFRKGELIGLVFAPSENQDVFDLLAGKASGKSIVDTPRFKEAVAEARSAEHALMYFDIKELLRQMKGLFERLQSKDRECCPEEAKRERQTIEAAVELCDVFDYAIMTMEMDGRRELIHSITRVQEGKDNSPLAKVFLHRKPFERFDQYIPADATGFNVNGFIDLEQLYKVVTDFIRQQVPNGADYLTKWNGLLAEVGFDPATDIFSWWSGEIISISLPPAVVTPMGGSDFVLMIRVKDSALARTKVNAAIDFLQAKLQTRGQMLMVSPAEVDAEGFREVTHPLLMMYLRPVIGVKDDWLVVGSSAATINKCQAVASGKAPSIMKNQRFNAEGLIPRGPVQSASFKDTSGMGQEIAQIFTMVGGMGQLFVANLPDDADDPAGHKKTLIKTILSTLMKLGPIMQKLDFYSSDASVTTVHGTLIRAERVVTYKGPEDDTTPKTAEAPQPLK